MSSRKYGEIIKAEIRAVVRRLNNMNNNTSVTAEQARYHGMPMPDMIPETGTEVKYQFVDRMFNYGMKALETNARGKAYNRLLFDSILSINPVSNSVRLYVSGVISVAVTRLADGDYYNARLLLEGAVRVMESEAAL